MAGDAQVRVSVLGAFQVTRGDVVLSVPGARLQALLVRLALADGQVVSRSSLIDAIWGDEPPAGAGHALQALVSRLRKIVGDVEQVAGGYRLELAEVDAVRFEQLTTRARAGDALELLAEAVALWGNRLGVEPPAVAAVSPAVATRLARSSIEAAVGLAEAELSCGRTTEAAARLNALLAEHPVHERATALLMDALAGQGRQADALALYGRVRESLAAALGVDPGKALRDRHLNLLRGESSGSASAGPVRPGNLPASLTRLIGREDDLALIGSLLGAGRLVTVVGPGGAGKTRLAIEAARSRPGYRDGTWMVDLASVTEPAKVGAAVLAAVGPRGAALFDAKARSEIDVLADQLGETLLVVDNCEHLIDAVAHLLSALLIRCPGLRVLATSRELLAIDGEALVPLGPLPLPEPDAELAEARSTASVRLFTERAAAVRPGFEVTDQNLHAVLRIVRTLDGLPLALELAAARLRTLGLADLAAGLSDRFGLLTTGHRTALPRHRTLRAVIAWSWDLLAPDARTVAERIAVLPGGITPASALAGCADTAVPAAAIWELLADLVDRSLLQFVPETGRYRMLETIREYGLEQLTEQGALPGVRDLTARYFVDLVARHDPLLRGPGQLDALRALRAEDDNVLASLRHLCTTGDADGAVELALSLTWYLHMLGRHTDAAYWLAEAVAVPAGQESVQRDIAKGLLLLEALESRPTLEGRSVDEQHAELRELADDLLSRPELPGFGGALVSILMASELETSPETIQRLVDGPDRWLAGLACLGRSLFAENSGNIDRFRGDVSLALDCFTASGDRWGQAKALLQRALLRQYDDDLDGVLADLTEAKRLAREFGSLSLNDETYIDLRLIDLHVRLGETAAAQALLAAARERALRSTAPETAILLDTRAASLLVRLGELDQARELIESVEAELVGGDYGPALAGVARAELCLELGDGAGAEKALAHAYARAVASKDMPLVATVAVSVAALALFKGLCYEAVVILGAAAHLRGAHDHTDPQVHAIRSKLAGYLTAYESGRQLSTPAALLQVDPARLSAGCASGGGR